MPELLNFLNPLDRVAAAWMTFQHRVPLLWPGTTSSVDQAY